MRIDQFVHTLNYGDAISGEALTISRLLLEHGIKSSIYSVNTHEKLIGQTQDYRLFAQDCRESAAKGEQTAVILHYSIASPLNQMFIEQAGVGRVVIYHNLTPVKWFTRYNARVAADLRRGLAELPDIARCADILLADSTFNREELAALGCAQASVLPLPLDDQAWRVAANRGILSVLKAHGGRNLLHVGRIAPNKCIEDIIKAFYFYHHKIEKKSRLWLIGSDIDTEIYSFELRRLVSELRLKESVYFVGSVSDCELRAFYEGADLYLCMSEHEGFCMPLLEAMHFGLPVIAFAAGAVPETVGDAAVLLERKSPPHTAELINYLLTEPAAAGSLQEKGRQRAAAFSGGRFWTELERKILQPLAGESRTACTAGR